jgi:sec-independent protein translocase protein TatB
MLSIPHLVVIFLIALIVLGPEKLPQVARVLGKAMADFRRITTDFRVQIEDEMREMERHTRVQQQMNSPTPSPAFTPPTYTPSDAELLGATLTPDPTEVPPPAATPAPATAPEKAADGDPHPA